MKINKKVISLLMAVLLLVTTLVPVSAQDSNSYMFGEGQRKMLETAYFEPDNLESYSRMIPDDIVVILEDIMIYKKNITDEFKIDVSTINESNFINQGVSTAAITEKYLNVPAGRYSGTHYEEFGTRGYGHKATSVFMTPALAKNHVLNKQSGSLSVILTALVDYVMSIKLDKFSPIFTVVTTAVNSYKAGIIKEVSKLALADKGVEIYTVKSTVGSVSGVKEWNQRNVFVRSGTETSSHLTKTYTYKMVWSANKE